MPTSTQLIYADNPGDLPTSYEAPADVDIVLDSVVARIDGAGAAAAFLPVLELLSQDNRVMARVRPDQEFAAGDTGVVTWAPFLRRRGAPQSFIGARVTKAAAQSIPNATRTDRTWDTVVFDTDNMVDLGVSDTRITFTKPGLYLVLAATNYAANAVGRRICQIVLNGLYSVPTGDLIGGFSLPAVADAGAGTVTPASTLYRFAAGDFITSGTFQASGGALNEGGGAAPELSFLACGRIGV